MTTNKGEDETFDSAGKKQKPGLKPTFYEAAVSEG
jgi:hypothetical protein